MTRTLARIEIDDTGKVTVASNLTPGPLVATLAAALTQVAGYIPEPQRVVESDDYGMKAREPAAFSVPVGVTRGTAEDLPIDMDPRERRAIVGEAH